MVVPVIGAELVVPKLKYVFLNNKDNADVGKYVLTRVETKLEMRMLEFYRSSSGPSRASRSTRFRTALRCTLEAVRGAAGPKPSATT